MKKFLIPSIVMSVLALTISAQAETTMGKVVSKQNNTIQVANNPGAAPATFKLTPNTNYYSKKRLTNENTAVPSNEIDNDDMVEIVYIIDPNTNEMLVEQIIILED